MSGALFTTPGAVALWLLATGTALAQSAATYGADSPRDGRRRRLEFQRLQGRWHIKPPRLPK